MSCTIWLEQQIEGILFHAASDNLVRILKLESIWFQAAEDKERYEREMKEYKKNGGSAAAGGSGGASTSGGGGGAAKKKTER